MRHVRRAHWIGGALALLALALLAVVLSQRRAPDSARLTLPRAALHLGAGEPADPWARNQPSHRLVAGAALLLTVRSEWTERLPEEPVALTTDLFNLGTADLVVTADLSPSGGQTRYELEGPELGRAAMGSLAGHFETDPGGTGQPALMPGWNGDPIKGCSLSSLVWFLPGGAEAGSPGARMSRAGEYRVHAVLDGRAIRGIQRDVVAAPLTLRVVGGPELPPADAQAYAILQAARDADGSVWGTTPTQAAGYAQLLQECPTSGYVPYAGCWASLAAREIAPERALDGFLEVARWYPRWAVARLSCSEATALLGRGLRTRAARRLLQEIADGTPPSDEYARPWAMRRLEEWERRPSPATR